MNNYPQTHCTKDKLFPTSYVLSFCNHLAFCQVPGMCLLNEYE